VSKIKTHQKMAEPSNVVSMNRAVTVEPLEGWKLHTKHGYMRRGPDAGDRLVRLHDVAAWLMSERELPLVLAVDAVCSALDANGLDGVYYLRSDVYATWAGEPSKWDSFAPQNDRPSTRLRAVWLMPRYELEKLMNVPGQPATYQAEERTPFEFAGSYGDGVGEYAVTLDKAHELWGWGRAVAWKEVAEAVPTQAAPNTDKSTKPRYDWKGDPELFTKLAVDFEDAPGATAKAKREHVGTVWQLSEVMVKKMLAEGKKPPVKSAKTRALGG
jgi:hypothetical protein